MATKLILSDTEANKYVKYLVGMSAKIEGSSMVFLGLGNMESGVFTEIPIDTAETEEEKTTNYARALVHTGDAYPDVLMVDTENTRRVYNHEQIVFNKVLATQYTANAIAFYRQETDGAPYAYGLLDTELTAAVGSLPMFEREQLQLLIPDGTEG